MADATEVTENVETPTEVSDLTKIQEELAKSKELISQLRKYEKSHKEKIAIEAEEKEKALAEQGKFQQLYEAEKARTEEFAKQFREIKLNAVINDVLTESKVKHPETLKELLKLSEIGFNEDGSVDIKSVKQQIADIQKKHSALFELPIEETPPAKTAVDAPISSNYAIEMKKATTQKEIIAVMKKYGYA